jgi:hypothetical protein
MSRRETLFTCVRFKVICPGLGINFEICRGFIFLNALKQSLNFENRIPGEAGNRR